MNDVENAIAKKLVEFKIGSCAPSTPTWMQACREAIEIHKVIEPFFAKSEPTKEQLRQLLLPIVDSCRR